MNDVDVDDINDLAQFIRQINGDNKMGTARLAEEILEWQADSIQRAEPVAEYTFYLDSGIRFFPLNAFDNLPKGKGYLYTRPQPAAKVPEHVIRKCEQAIEYASEIRGGCISGVREGQKRVRAILSTPQQSTHDLAGQQVGVPEGWRLVPADYLPEEMENAAVDAAREYMERTGGNCMKTIYKALVDAAPQPPREQGGE